MTYEIVELTDSDVLKSTHTNHNDDSIVSYVGIDLKNNDYQTFLAWNAEQQTPLTLPEEWPTNS